MRPALRLPTNGVRPGARAMLLAVALITIGCGRTSELWDLRIGFLPAGEESPAPGAYEWDEAFAALVAARRASLDTLIGDLSEPAHRAVGDVVVRLSLTGGWSHPGNDLHVSVADDGRVVRVTDTSVYSSTDDYTSLRLSPNGIVRLIESVRPLLSTHPDDLDGGAGVSPTDRSAWLEVGRNVVFSMDRLSQTDGYGPEQQAQRRVFDKVIEGVKDLSWLGDDIIEAEAPWVPETMTVLATPVVPGGQDRGGAAMSWPLDRPMVELATGTEISPAGDERLVVCLAGSDVAPVFGLLTGVNHARLPVHDGKSWELDVRPHYPGYRLASDPCP